ncbi:sodium/calcium exchanger 1-like [Oppia nitens]|uniref:sodium/calcium exchanger 1-like n=1 Tax=Oppia nitens TaxID=1686743 RepID=UPI0023DB1FD7|nr:sodium/calcium exchanger 1-like [Oppia nitens]
MSLNDSILNETFDTLLKSTVYGDDTPGLQQLATQSTNISSNISDYLIDLSSTGDYHVCVDGVIIPFWPHYDSTGLIIFHGIVYLLALIYIFVGVAIIADRFMAAIEQITSQEQDVIVRKPNGDKEIISVRIWNETVSNLTLMALGSSAPEILLSVIEICGNNFRAGDLGPGTIVGSAAFNMFVIIAICVWVVPKEAKKIKFLRVFCITMTFSVFAYIWLLYILIWSSYGIIEIWEAFLTFLFFPITVLIAYIADKRLLIYKYLDKRYRMKRGRKEIYQHSDVSDGENVELNSVETNGIKVKVNDVEIDGDFKYIDANDEDLQNIEDHREEIVSVLRDIKQKNPNASTEELEELARKELDKLQPKSKAYYRIQAARRLMGNVTELVKDHILKSINEDFDGPDDNKDDNSIKIFFNPKEYTVLENIGTFQLTISRSGGLESTILIDYTTEDGTAKSGSDYEAISGTLSFGPGEQHKQISVKIINDDIYEEDENFYVRLSAGRYLTPVSESDIRPNILISDSEAKVTILDDDHSGVFSFTNNIIQVPESVGDYRLKVSRFVGARGHIALPFKTIAGTAKPNIDFRMMDTKIEFANNETHKEIILNINNTDSYEKNVAFYVEIGQPYRVDSNKNITDDKGAPRLGELVKCTVRIRESRDFKATVDKLMRQKKAVTAISSASWEGQFYEAVRVPSLTASKEPEDEGDVIVVKKKSILSYIVHYLTLFWKILFACVPPPYLWNGWACFIVSIIVIGLLTALINDLASQFGCTIGLKDSVTAISLVALGTSVPDTFASKIAALNDKYADSSIGNVTGSNAVNVFLGIGVAWTIAAVYHAVVGTPGGFAVDPGNLSFSVTIFCLSALVCAATLLARRSKVVGGELGGPMIYKLPTTILFVSLWLFYIIISSLEVYHYIKI